MNLHTRAVCDSCGSPATIELPSGWFICGGCDADFYRPSETTVPDSAPPSARPEAPNLIRMVAP